MDLLLFRLMLRVGRPGLQAVLGDADAHRVLAEAPQELGALLPRIPDLGKPAARTFLLVTAWLVAVRRAIPDRAPSDATAALGGAFRSAARFVPRPARRLYRAIFFAPWYHRRLVDGLVGPGAFQGELVAHPGGFGVNYTGCALQVFLRSLGHPELGPEICGLDEVESDIFELGLTRTGTIGRGASACDFRWTRVAPPEGAP